MNVFVFPIVHNDYVIPSNAFFKVLARVQEIYWFHWIAEEIVHQKHVFGFQKKKIFWKLDLFENFDLTMIWISFFMFKSSQIVKLPCQKTHLKILGLVTFFDLTLTLTWAKYEKITCQYLRLVLGSTYGKFWPTKATFEVSTIRNLNTLDFDIWPDFDLTRDLDFKF